MPVIARALFCKALLSLQTEYCTLTVLKHFSKLHPNLPQIPAPAQPAHALPKATRNKQKKQREHKNPKNNKKPQTTTKNNKKQPNPQNKTTNHKTQPETAPNARAIRASFCNPRKSISKKLQNPKLLRISFHTFRH